MIRGTTPTIQIQLPDDVPVKEIDAAVFSFAQNDTEIIKKTLPEMMIDADTNSMIIELSQQETLRFADNMLVSMQLKLRRLSNVETTDIVMLPVQKIINNEVI